MRRLIMIIVVTMVLAGGIMDRLGTVTFPKNPFSTVSADAQYVGQRQTVYVEVQEYGCAGDILNRD